MSDKPLRLAAAATLLVAILSWAVATSSRVSALEAREADHEQRIVKAERDAEQYRQDIVDVSG